jgi:hypothetical protein
VVLTLPDAAPTDAGPPPSPPAKIASVVFAEDGSLIVELVGRLVSVGATGARTEYAFPADALLTWDSPAGHSAVIDDRHAARLVSLAPLAEVHQGARSLLQGTAVIDGTEGHDIAVVLLPPHATTLARLILPRADEVIVDNVNLTASGHFAIVTWREGLDGGTRDRAQAYSLATMKPTGDVLPMPSMSMDGPRATLDGDRQVGLRGEDVVVIDLATASVLRKAHLACPPRPPGAGEIHRANPTVDPRGANILVTCDLDGVLLDAQTLRPKRTFTHLVPGCDNGYDLGAHFNADGSRLILEGCGGEARLNVTTGKFSCGDGDGLMGQSYDSTSQTRPSQAIGVPRCRADADSSTTLSPVSAHYVHEQGPDTNVLIGPGSVRVKLEEGIRPSVSPKEDRFAYTDGTTVFLRALPSGAPLSPLTF